MTKVPVISNISKIFEFYICVDSMPTLDESIVKYARENVVLDRENCGWYQQVGQTVVSLSFFFFVVMAQHFLVGQGLIIEVSQSHSHCTR